ncbi:oleate hydratase [Streptomyces griseorubiginosus]|uniref:oleate hydratase n=1 Tax=Streptomyces griseorubiginosus TaxID=67304 RepID=UPI0033DBD3FE
MTISTVGVRVAAASEASAGDGDTKRRPVRRPLLVYVMESSGGGGRWGGSRTRPRPAVRWSTLTCAAGETRGASWELAGSSLSLRRRQVGRTALILTARPGKPRSGAREPAERWLWIGRWHTSGQRRSATPALAHGLTRLVPERRGRFRRHERRHRSPRTRSRSTMATPGTTAPGWSTRRTGWWTHTRWGWMRSTTFAFEPWHSSIWFRRYPNRFIHVFKIFDSVRPLMKWQPAKETSEARPSRNLGMFPRSL